jgi:hypothetical protein
MQQFMNYMPENDMVLLLEIILCMPLQNDLIPNMPSQNGYSRRCHQITIFFLEYAIHHRKILNCPCSFFLLSHRVTKTIYFVQISKFDFI